MKSLKEPQKTLTRIQKFFLRTFNCLFIVSREDLLSTLTATLIAARRAAVRSKDDVSTSEINIITLS